MAAVDSRRRRSFLQYLSDNNPFYLLSAASMLLACLLLSNTTTWSPIAARKLVMLIVTLNIYELLIVALGLFLIVKRDHGRDGLKLLCVEAVFLADVGFLNSELYTESLRLGLIVNAVLLVVGLLKLLAIFSALKLPIRSPVFAMAGGVLTALLGHAAIFKWIGDHHQGRLPDVVMYTAWWLFGAIVVGYALMAKIVRPSAFRGQRAGSRGGVMGHVILTMMLLSLAGHLGTSHWIYSCPFQAPDVSPALLALAVLIAGFRGPQFTRRGDASVLCMMLPLAAIISAAHPSRPLEVALETLRLSPLMLSAGFAYITWVGIFAPRHFVRFVGLALVGVAAYLFGPTWASIQRWAELLYHAIGDVFDRLTPHTQGAWGTLALIGAFLLLAIGAAVSLFRPKESDPPVAPQPPSESLTM